MSTEFQDAGQNLSTRKLLDQLDTVFVFIFTAELGINLFCRWFWPFVKNQWCMFDLFVVGISLISLAPVGVPFDLVLLFRCCRVLRVVGRFKTVRSIVSILWRSFVPMASAFFLIFLLSSICEFKVRIEIFMFRFCTRLDFGACVRRGQMQ